MNQSRFAVNQGWLLAFSATLAAIAVGILVTTPYKWLGIGAIITGGLVIISLGNTDWIFTYLYPLLIGVGQIPLSLGDTTISLERILVFAGAVGVIAAILSQRLSIAHVPGDVALGLGLWLGMYALSLGIFPSTAGQVRVFGFAQTALMTYLILTVIQTPRQIQVVLKLMLVSSFILSLFTIIVYFQEGSLTTIRLSSFARGETVTESLLAGVARAGAGNTMAIWLALIFLSQAKTRKQRMLMVILIGWFGILALFALRREVLVILPVGIGFLLWRNPMGKRLQILGIGLVLLALIGAFVLYSPEWMNRLSVETAENFEEGTDPRWMLLTRFTPTAFATSPWIGHGPGNYASLQLQFPETVPTSSLLKGGSAPHNVWSAALVEAGVFSFAGLCLFLYGLGRPLLLKRKTGDRNLDVIWSFAPLLFVQILLKMFFGNFVILPVNWFWFGFFIALEQVTRKASLQETKIP